MIDYIKYTIDGKTFSLINNGDGTWSKDLNAPDVAGMYNLLLEIGQDGIKTYIDSSDPRYTFYLEVIEEIERNVNLIEYLPPILQDVLEFQVISDAENIEFDLVYNEINKTYLDSFIRTAGGVCKMILVTSDKNVVVECASDSIDRGEFVLINNVHYQKGIHGVFEVGYLPDDFETFKYSYTPEKGFYLTPIPEEPPKQPTIEEKLAEKDRQIQALKEQQVKMDSDLAAFMDFVLMGGI
jgi:hypothetical protein